MKASNLLVRARGGGLESAVRTCCKEGGVHVIDVPVDYSDNQRLLIDELNNKKQMP